MNLFKFQKIKLCLVSKLFMTKKAYTKNEDNEYNKKNIIPELFPIKLSEAFFNKSELIFRKKKLSKQTEYFVIEYIYIYLK